MKKPRQSKHQPDQVKEYLKCKGWELKLEGQNFKVQICVFCGNSKSNFEVHKDRGMYKCWACGAEGSFFRLKKHLGDAHIDAVTIAQLSPEDEEPVKQEDLDQLTKNAERAASRIWKRQDALQYLKNRGFNEESIQHFKLGCVRKDGGDLWITIPHLMNGKCMNLKYRNISGGALKWKQEKAGKRILYNVDALEQYDEIVITEGELKAVALWQVGIKNVIGLPQGVETFKPEFIDQLMKMKKIYLVMDSDIAGQKGAEKLGIRLGIERTYNVVIDDGKDPDEYLFEKGHTVEEFKALMKRAKLMDVRNIVSLQDAFRQLGEQLLTQDKDSFDGYQTPWPNVNQIIKGLRKGELIVLSSPPKYGKSTMALNISYHLAKDENVPVLFMCMEMGPDRLARKLTSMETSVADENISFGDVMAAKFEMRGKPFYLPERVRTEDPEKIFETIRACHKRYGIEFLVFDNLHFLCRQVDKLREQVGVVVQNFKLLAEELHIPVLLIVHPRKLKGKGPMTSDDLRESAAIHADADMVIILHRKRLTAISEDDNYDDDGDDARGILSEETSIIVDANRYGADGTTKLLFLGEKSKFVEMHEERRE